VTPLSITASRNAVSRCIAAVVALVGPAPCAMAIDLAALWDFNDPARSEQRFRSVLADLSGDDALIVQTQIARAYGLRKDFTRARELLRSLEPSLAGAGPEARIRHALETGRTFSSAAHAPPSQTPQAKESARAAYLRAFGLAKSARLDDLAIDALHMLAFVDTEPADQLKWAQEALGVVLASSQPAARQWEGSIRNNIGYALHQLGRYDEALAEFQRAVGLREAAGNARAIRVAYWMVAWTLRALNRIDDALEIQLRLEREGDVADAPDPYVFEELEQLYLLKADAQRARHYAERRQAIRP
jgi:tetratricopeptide (TPR) repeat protein